MPKHMLIVGLPGTGKTIAQKLFMASLLSDGGTGITYRAAIFDPKCELYAFFRKLGIAKEHLIVTHPFDKRCVAWNLADDFNEIAHAETFAQCFFPVRHGANAEKTDHPDFWQNAANDVLQQIICALIKTLPDSWELRDVTQICSEIDTMKQMLAKTDEGQNASSNYFDPRTLGDDRLPDHVRATIRSRMSKFHVLATLLHKREACFSIRKWREGSGIILLGHDSERAPLMATFNNLLVKRMSEISVHQRYPANPADLTWFFFDELVEAGEFSGFHRLLNFGRERGVRVMIGFCDKAGLEQAFTTHKQVVSLCAGKVFFRLGSAESARWAADECGSVFKEVVSKSINPQREIGFQMKAELHHRILPDKFLRLPESEEGELACYAILPRVGVIRSELSASEVDLYLPQRVADDDPERFQERPPSDQDAESLTWDYESLGIVRPNHQTRNDDDPPPLAIFRS